MSKETTAWMDALLIYLDRHLSAHDFRLKKTNLDFWRKTSYGADNIGFTKSSTRGTALIVDVHLGVRHTDVEELSNLVASSLPAKYRSTTMTVGGEFGHLTARGWHARLLKSPDDVRTEAADIWEGIRAKGLPYFERFSDLREVVRVLSIDDRRSPDLIHCNFDLPRAKRAVAAAFVLRDRPLFDELTEHKLEFLEKKSKQSPNVGEFVRLVALLTEHWGQPLEKWIASYRL